MPGSTNALAKLLEAREKAEGLFSAIEAANLIAPGQTEKQVSQNIYDLAYELHGIRKYWHKRIVRAGRNTLCPYRENPPNLTIANDDIVFLDFGPIFETWEADFGRTYVLGDDAEKLRLRDDLPLIFADGRRHFEAEPAITGHELYDHVCQLARANGWVFGNVHAGHLIGEFPHEKIQGEQVENYIHPDNHVPLRENDRLERPRHWILEIHLVNREREFGGFFEDLLTI